ncbi:MAG: hypothetical protein VX479_03645 [Verrucomicrobiota bacterium]|nr:hypothetical protein [Verrucomicrobiota bacterium]
MNGLVVGKIRRPKSSRGKPLLQNYHGKPGSTLSMNENDRLLLLHGLLHGCLRDFTFWTPGNANEEEKGGENAKRCMPHPGP